MQTQLDQGIDRGGQCARAIMCICADGTGVNTRVPQRCIAAASRWVGGGVAGPCRACAPCNANAFRSADGVTCACKAGCARESQSQWEVLDPVSQHAGHSYSSTPNGPLVRTGSIMITAVMGGRQPCRRRVDAAWPD